MQHNHPNTAGAHQNTNHHAYQQQQQQQGAPRNNAPQMQQQQQQHRVNHAQNPQHPNNNPQQQAPNSQYSASHTTRDILNSTNLLAHIKAFRFHLHTFYHEALAPTMPPESHSKTSGRYVSKADQIDKLRAKSSKYCDLIVRDVDTCLRTSSAKDILNETSDVLQYKDQKTQESHLQQKLNHANIQEIQAEINQWNNEQPPQLASNPSNNYALTHASLYFSQYMDEKWDRIPQLVSHMNQLLKLPVERPIVWDQPSSRLQMNCQNIFVCYIYLSDRRKLPLPTSLPDQLRQREDNLQMQKLMDESNTDRMLDEDEPNTNNDGSNHMMLHTKSAATMDINDATVAFIEKEKLSEIYIDHIAVLALHEPVQIYPVSRYAVFRDIQKQLMKAVEYYSGCDQHKTYLLQSILRYIHAYHRLYEKRTRYTNQLLDSNLLPPYRTFHTYSARSRDDF